MKSRFFLIGVLVICFGFPGWSQSNFNYEITLVPVTNSGLPGLQSYAYAQHEGKWLIIGGRKDGLHARQPFNTFPEQFNNTDIYVFDVASHQSWSSTVNVLPTGIKEQLQSTNMNFYQDHDTLYIIGGYGFSATANNHITYTSLASINVPELIYAIQNNQSIAPYFKQIQDNVFAVSGGHLKKIGNLFYLVGGHRFDGRYNPFGNPTYTQTYTNQIRKFSINNSGTQLSYGNYSAITDLVHLRRRDYNLLPHYSNKVIQLSEINQNQFLIGHIFGGIHSPSLHPFFNVQTNTTYADTSIYEVWLTATPESINEYQIDGSNPYIVSVYPNPFEETFKILFSLEKPVNVNYLITNSLGQIVLQSEPSIFESGDHSIDVKIKKTVPVEPLFLILVFDNKYYVTKKLIKK